jgi:hypothetical protein
MEGYTGNAIEESGKRCIHGSFERVRGGRAAFDKVTQQTKM